MTSWKTEEEEQSQQEPQHQTKAHLVLEGSDQHEWGVVKDCHGNVNFIPEDAEVVGTWNKYGEGVFWVSLETPIQALQDKATLLFVKLAEERKREVARRPVRKQPSPKEPTGPSVFDKLRASTKKQ